MGLQPHAIMHAKSHARKNPYRVALNTTLHYNDRRPTGVPGMPSKPSQGLLNAPPHSHPNRGGQSFDRISVAQRFLLVPALLEGQAELVLQDFFVLGRPQVAEVSIRSYTAALKQRCTAIRTTRELNQMYSVRLRPYQSPKTSVYSPIPDPV